MSWGVTMSWVSGPCRLDMSFGSGEEAVRGVWRGWIRLAAGAARSPTAIRRERQNWIVKHVAGKPNSGVSDFQGAVESLAASTLVHLKPFMTSERLGVEVQNLTFSISTPL